MVKIRDCITLKACRVITGVDAKEFAESVGVTVDTVYRWERNLSAPNVRQLKKIKNFYAEKGYIVENDDIIF